MPNVKKPRGAAEPIRFDSDRLNDLDRKAYAKRSIADPRHPIAFYISVLLVAVGTLSLVPLYKSLHTSLLASCFAFGPLVLAMLPMWFWRNSMSQFLLTVAAIAYGVWFLLIYLFVMQARDSMAYILFAYIGGIATPFLLVICWISGLIQLWSD